MTGQFLGCDETTALFAAPLFRDPISVRLGELSHVELAAGERQPKGPFIALLADETNVAGDIVAITGASVTMRNARLGDLVLQREEIVSIRRIDASDPGGVPPVAVSSALTDFLAGEVPVLRKPNLNAAPAADAKIVTIPSTLPEMADIVLKMRVKPEPRFKLVITGANGRNVILEATEGTLHGDLVLQGRVFLRIWRVPAVDGFAKLHLLWNQRTGACHLYSSTGEPLGDTNRGPVADVLAEKQGVRTENRGAVDSIELLGVNSWDGELPKGDADDKPSVRLVDGSVVTGTVVSSDAREVLVRPEKGGEIKIMLEKIAKIKLVRRGIAAARPRQTELWFHDGTRIGGKLTGIKDGTGAMMTRFGKEPVKFALGDVARVMFSGLSDESDKSDSSAIEFFVDTLHHDAGVLHGDLMPGGEGLRWKTRGTVAAVMIASGVEFSISRMVGKGAGADDALFFLSNGEVLSGKLSGMTRESIDAEWVTAGRATIPADMLRAIRLPGDRVSISGFDDEGWVPIANDKGAVSLKKDEALMKGSCALGHPDIMRADEIRFTWEKPERYATLTMKLFCNEVSTTASGVSFYLQVSNSAVRVMQQIGTGRYRTISPDMRFNERLAVRLKTVDEGVQVFIDDSRGFLISVPEEQRHGSGLVMSSNASLQRRVLAVANGKLFVGTADSPIKLTGLSTQTTGTGAWSPFVLPHVKAEALTIPRFRKDDPPRHILIGANRDVLRGEIEAIAGEHLRFRSGLDVVTIPLARIAAIITPKEPTNERSASSTETLLLPDKSVSDILASAIKRAREGPPPAHLVTLNNGARIRMTIEHVDAKTMSGAHPLLGRCTVPLAQVKTIQSPATATLPSSSGLHTWQLAYAREPVLPESGGEENALLDKGAPVFSLPLLGGGDFDLSKHAGKVVVLDFWATWCGPCVKSLPGLIEAMSVFPADKVALIGVNQGESETVVQKFLEVRGWKLTVARDSAQKVARAYGVEGIPHTVIIGRDGKIVWVKTGFTSESADEAAAAVRKALGE